MPFTISKQSKMWVNACASALAFCAPSIALAAPTLVDFGFDSVYHDNISRTPDSMGDEISGAETHAFASVRKGFILSEDLSFMIKIGADYKAQHISESADYVGANAVFAATYRPFNGVSSPYFKASLEGQHRNYLNDFGDEQVYRAKFSVNSQITNALRAQLGVVRRFGEAEWAPIDTINIESWDTERTEYSLSMDLNLDTVTLYTKIARSDGDGIWTRREAAGFVGVFGDNVKNESIELGLNYPLSHSAVLDVLASYREVTRNSNELYESGSLSVAYIQRLSF